MAALIPPSSKLVPRTPRNHAPEYLPYAIVLTVLTVLALAVLGAQCNFCNRLQSFRGWDLLLVFFGTVAADEWVLFANRAIVSPANIGNEATILLPIITCRVLEEFWALWELNDGNDGGTCLRRVVSLARTKISLITSLPLCVSVILFFWAFSGSPSDNADQGVKWGLAVAGESIILLIAVFHLLCATISSLYLKHKPGMFDSRNRLKAYGVFTALTVASCCVVVRVCATVAYFRTRRQDLNPVTGATVFKVIIVLVPEALAIIGFLTGFYLTADLTSEDAARAGGTAAPHGQLGVDGAADERELQPRRRDEERAEGAGNTSGQTQNQGQDSESSAAGRPGFPACRISRNGEAVTPGRLQAQTHSEGTRAEGVRTGTSPQGSSNEEHNVHPGVLCTRGT